MCHALRVAERDRVGLSGGLLRRDVRTFNRKRLGWAVSSRARE
jgi:hypothetical protein